MHRSLHCTGENLDPNQEEPVAHGGCPSALNLDDARMDAHRPCKRSYAPWDTFFQEGNAAREVLVKKGLRELGRQSLQDVCEEIQCGIDGCRYVSSSTEEYERHYAHSHVNSCSVCKANFRTCRLLGLHVQETHDSFFRAMAKRENMYECLVEGCGKKFKGELQRHWHLVNLHKYPRSLQFNVKGAKKRKEGKKKPQAHENMEREDAQGGEHDEEMEDLCAHVQRIKIPSSISFGAKREVAFEKRKFNDHRKKKDKEEKRNKERNLSVMNE